MSLLCERAEDASISFHLKGPTAGITVVPQVQPAARVSFTNFSISVLSMPVFTVVITGELGEDGFVGLVVLEPGVTVPSFF